jgi:nucleotide-binding universal stress UspA family protein
MTFKTFQSHGVLEQEHKAPLEIKRILVPVDFSEASNTGVRHAVVLAKHFGSDLMVLNVVPPVPALACQPIDGIPAYADDELALSERNLAGLTKSAEQFGVRKTRAVIRIGLPSHEIVEAAKDADIDLIVIATHGYTGWKHFCIGSTAERVVRAAPCPVLVVREKEHEFR